MKNKKKYLQISVIMCTLCVVLGGCNKMMKTSENNISVWLPKETQTATEIFPIWSQGEAPGARTSSVQLQIIDRAKDGELSDRAVLGVRAPEITVYKPKESNGIGVLITPGGAFVRTAIDKEGSDLAPLMNDRGFTLFVLTYRLPGDGHEEGVNAPLADAQRAMRVLRERSEKWGLKKIGVMGFSAGGHVAASLGTRYDEQVYQPVDEIDTLGAQPDFLVLVYPVINMELMISNVGSLRTLFGDTPTAEQLKRLSPDQNVTDKTAPAFILHTLDDTTVPIENSLSMFNALREKNVPVEMHLFKQGGHGFGLRGVADSPTGQWLFLLMNWLNALP